MVIHSIFDSIEQKFLVCGHSFMRSDGDFSLIEKRKKVMKTFVPKDLQEIFCSDKYNPLFEVVDMQEFGV